MENAENGMPFLGKTFPISTKEGTSVSDSVENNRALSICVSFSWSKIMKKQKTLKPMNHPLNN